MKCRTKIDENKEVDDQFIEDFIRHEFLKFFVYTNKLIKNGTKKKMVPQSATS